MKQRKTLGKEMEALYLPVSYSRLHVGYESIQLITYAQTND